jgi:hypothetical protein
MIYSFCLTEVQGFFVLFQRTFVLPHTRRRWAFRGVGFWRWVGGSTVFAEVFILFFFFNM